MLAFHKYNMYLKIDHIQVAVLKSVLGSSSKIYAGLYNGTPVQIYPSSGVPSGVICIWSGAANAIPSGWYLCDGNNGTPNLSGKFVIGYSSIYTVGKTGGAETHTLTTAEMPSHTHSLSSVTATITNGFKHYTSRGGNRYESSSANASPGVEQVNASVTLSGNTSSAGSGTAHNNLPPYYALCYIMKA